MIIAIVTPEYPPYTNWGGIATFCYNLSILLNKMGHSIHVITYDGKGDTKKTVKMNGITIHYIQFKTKNILFNIVYYKFPLGFLRFLLNKAFPEFLPILDWNIFSLLAFREETKRIPFQAIHSTTYHMPSVLISFFFKKIPLILHAQGPNDYFYQIINTRSRSINSLKNIFEAWHMNHYAKRIVACSLNVKNKLLKKFPQLTNKVIHIPNFVDYSQLEHLSQPNKNNIVFLGRLDNRKGVDLLLRSFLTLVKKTNDINLFLIGDKNRAPETLWQSIPIPLKIQKKIFYFPRIDDKNSLIELLKRIKGIAVFPSRYEPFGFVIVETMALGYLVIASKNGGGNEIIKHNENGLLSSPSTKSLISNLQYALTLKGKDLERITQNARNTIKKQYDFSSVQKQYMLLEKTI